MRIEFNHYVKVNGVAIAGFIHESDASNFVDIKCGAAIHGTDISHINNKGEEIAGWNADGTERIRN